MSTLKIRRLSSKSRVSAIVLADESMSVAAYRDDSIHHLRRRWPLERVLEAEEAFGVSALVLSGFPRIVTHPLLFAVPGFP